MSLMPQTPFQWFVPATTGDGLVPAAEYKAKFYSAGTTTPKAIYTDPGLTVPYPSPSNTAELDAEGRALIYLGIGGYKLVITEPDDTPIYTQDNITGEGSFGTGFAASYAALADVNSTLNPYTYIAGYYTPGDGGEGMFYNTTSGTPADGGYVQVVNDNPAKRWFRIPDENGDVRAASFGYCGAGVKTDNLIAADSYAASIGARLRIQNDNTTSTTVTLSSSVVFNQDAALKASGSSTVTVNGIVTAGGWNLFGSWTSVSLTNASQETRPEWLGASLDGSGAANATAFTKWKAAGGGVFIVPPGAWAHTGGFVPVAGKITLFYGSVGTTPRGAFYPASSQILVAGGFGGGGTTITDSIEAEGVIHSGNYVQADNNVQTPYVIVGAGGVDSEGTITVSAGNVSASGSVEAGATVEAGGNIIGHADANINGSVDAGGTVHADGDITGDSDAVIVGQIQAGSFDTTGGVTADGDVEADGHFAAGTYSQAGAQILAGQNLAHANGFVTARAGTGANYFKAGGAGQVALTSDNVTVGAGSLVNNGDYIKIVCSGTTTNGQPTLQIKIGATVIFQDANLNANAGTSPYRYMMEVYVYRTGATSAFITGTAVIGSDVTGGVYSSAAAQTATITWSASNTFTQLVSATVVYSLTMYNVYQV